MTSKVCVRPEPFPEGSPTPTGQEDGEEIIGVPSWDSANRATPGGAQRPRKGAAKQWRRTCSIPRRRSTEVANWAFLAGRVLLAGLTSCKAQVNDIGTGMCCRPAEVRTNCQCGGPRRAVRQVHNRLP